MERNLLENLMQKPMRQFFLGYSLQCKAYRVFNMRTLCVEEFVCVCDDNDNYDDIDLR